MQNFTIATYLSKREIFCTHYFWYEKVKVKVNLPQSRHLEKLFEISIRIIHFQIWHNIIELDLSNNNINSIDKSIKLVPRVQVLSIVHNKISKIENLTHLSSLSNINLSSNLITDCPSLHTKLGKISSIDLSLNGIKTLKGFEKLYSLESLDVSSNQITDIDEMKHIGLLPCLENVRLTGNPVAVIVDYRVKVLEYFGRRAAEIYLDNEKATQKEIDTASVLQALRIVKEGKTPDLNQKFV